MKRSIVIVVIGAVILSLCMVPIYAQQNEVKMNEGYTSLVAQIPTGTGENKIQIDPHPEGATAMGPEALTVSPNGI